MRKRVHKPQPIHCMQQVQFAENQSSKFEQLSYLLNDAINDSALHLTAHYDLNSMAAAFEELHQK